MIHTHLDEERNIIHISPDGKLQTADFDTLTQTINARINRVDKVPAIVIETRHRPHWESFKALLHHLKFIKEYHKLVPKVAIVSDSKALSIARSLADHFTQAKVRYFPSDLALQAVDWASASDDHPGEFQLIDQLPSNVVGVEAHGVITAQDYDKQLIPHIQEKLKTHDHINLLFVAGDAFRTYSAGAVWDDTRFGMMHLADFEKIAIVSDVDWIRMGAKIFGPLMLGKLHVFAMSELDEAKRWVKR